MCVYLREMSYEFLIFLWWERREKNIFMIIFPLKQLIKCFLLSRLFWLWICSVFASICVNRFSIDNLICSFSFFLALAFVSLLLYFSLVSCSLPLLLSFSFALSFARLPFLCFPFSISLGRFINRTDRFPIGHWHPTFPIRSHL